MSAELYTNYWVVDGEVVGVPAEGPELICKRSDQAIERYRPTVTPALAVSADTRIISEYARTVRNEEGMGRDLGLFMDLKVVFHGHPEASTIDDPDKLDLEILTNTTDQETLHGRTGILKRTRDGIASLGETYDGQTYLMMLKGSGLPDGSLKSIDDLLGNEVMYGGMTAAEARAEAEALVWAESCGLTRERLIGYGHIAVKGTDDGNNVLLKLVNSTVRLSHYNAAPIAELEADHKKRREVLKQVALDMVIRIANTSKMPCYTTTAPHLQNFLLEPDGRVALTDFEDQARLGTNQTPRMHGQTGTCQNTYDNLKEYYEALEYVRGYQPEDFIHIRQAVVEELDGSELTEGLVTKEALGKIAAAEDLTGLADSIWTGYLTPINAYMRAKDPEQHLDAYMLADLEKLIGHIESSRGDKEAHQLINSHGTDIKLIGTRAKSPVAAMAAANNIALTGYDIHNVGLRMVRDDITLAAIALAEGRYEFDGETKPTQDQATAMAELLIGEARVSAYIARLRTIHHEYLDYCMLTIAALGDSIFDYTPGLVSQTLISEALRLKSDMKRCSDEEDHLGIMKSTKKLYNSIFDLALVMSDVHQGIANSPNNPDNKPD